MLQRLRPVDRAFGQLKSRKLFTQELAVLLCLVSLMVSIGQGHMTASNRLNSFGHIIDPSRMAQLLFKSSFEDLAIIGTTSEPGIDLGVSNYISLTGTGSQVWIEDGSLQSPHTGSRCLGLRSASLTTVSVRAESELTHLDGSIGYPNNYRGLNITGDIYLSVWIYFPTDWSLRTPGAGYSPTWYELFNPFVLLDNYYNPRTCLHIHRDSGGVYDLTLEYDYSASGPKTSWVLLDPFTVPLGRWSKWAWFIHRSTDPTEAYMKLWLDDQLLVTATDQNGLFRTKGTTPNWFLAYAKTYLTGEGAYHYLWADDLEVWSDLP